MKAYVVVDVYLYMDTQLSDMINCHIELTLTVSKTDSLCNPKQVRGSSHRKTYLSARLWINSWWGVLTKVKQLKIQHITSIPYNIWHTPRAYSTTHSKGELS